MKSSSKSYTIANLLFAGVIMSIILYSYIFHGTNHPIPALLTDITGLVPPSKGLSSSFSEIVRGNLEMAKIYNPFGLQIFLFFAIQFLLRLLSIVFVKSEWVKSSTLIWYDIAISTLLFILCFAPFIKYSFNLFSELFK